IQSRFAKARHRQTSVDSGVGGASGVACCRMKILEVLYRQAKAGEGIGEPLLIKEAAARWLVRAFRASRTEQDGVAIIVHAQSRLDDQQTTILQQFAQDLEAPEGIAQVINDSGAENNVKLSECVGAEIVKIPFDHADSRAKEGDEQIDGPARQIIIYADHFLSAELFGLETKQSVAAPDIENAFLVEVEPLPRPENHLDDVRDRGPPGGCQSGRKLDGVIKSILGQPCSKLFFIHVEWPPG